VRGFGDPLGSAVNIVLPKIDIPIAYAWCETWLPDGMKVRKWSGPLRRVDRYSSETATASLEYGSSQLAEGYHREDRPAPTAPGPAKVPASQPSPPTELETTAAKPPEANAPAVEPAYVNARLGLNYWRAGKDLYERNDFEQARESLEKAIELAPDTPEAANAKRLLANIDLAGGKLKLESKAQKAAGAQVKGEQRKELATIEQQQQVYIEQGRKAAVEGKLAEARSQLEAAEALSGKALRMGGQKAEQSAQMTEAREVLEQVRGRQRSQAGSLLAKSDRLASEGRYGDALNKAREAAKLGDDDTDRLAI
jgi:tetratricopeptide (TPR) repeat protein